MEENYIKVWLRKTTRWMTQLLYTRNKICLSDETQKMNAVTTREESHDIMFIINHKTYLKWCTEGLISCIHKRWPNNFPDMAPHKNLKYQFHLRKIRALIT